QYPVPSTQRAKRAALHPYVSESSSTEAVDRSLKSETMMARPTTTSAAATTMMKNTATWPLMSLSARPAATRVRFTALSISSMHMNMTSALRRMRRPSAPTRNRAAASAIYQPGATISSFSDSGRSEEHTSELQSRENLV